MRNDENDYLPTDDIIFSGDLWLMRGPVYDYSFIDRLPYNIRFMHYKVKNWLSGKRTPRLSIREQDEAAKEALKRGFTAVRVKPGHGDEFIGSKMIPQSILATRDILVKLGFLINENKDILEEMKIAMKVSDLREAAYRKFLEELISWNRWGYPFEDISENMLRIYREQSGGRGLVKIDRKERRLALEETLVRLRDDEMEMDILRKIAQSAHLMIQSDKDRV
jgi:hypothetical protein